MIASTINAPIVRYIMPRNTGGASRDFSLLWRARPDAVRDSDRPMGTVCLGRTEAAGSDRSGAVERLVESDSAGLGLEGVSGRWRSQRKAGAVLEAVRCGVAHPICARAGSKS